MSAHERNVLIAQLVAARSQIDATLAVLLIEECPHPEDQVEYTGTFGDPGKYRCKACGAESENPFNVQEE